MDVTIFLTRPDEGNNYLTEVHVKKMRYDIPIPTKRLVVAPSEHDSIEFYNANALGQAISGAWDVEDEIIEEMNHADEQEPEPTEEDPFAGWKPSEKLAYIKAQRLFEELSPDEPEE